MKGKFIGYDESTGKVTIEADTQVEPSSKDPIHSEMLDEFRFDGLPAQLLQLLDRPEVRDDKKYYYLIVPEAHRSIFKITPNARVEACARGSNGSEKYPFLSSLVF